MSSSMASHSDIISAQGHWRKLSRNDLLTSDPDTPPAHIRYEVLAVSHGRLILLAQETQEPEPFFFKEMDSAKAFTQVQR